MATTKRKPGKVKGAQQAGKGEAVRQTELLRIAAELFAERGYAATTVRDIADAAGILSGSLYHHFDSKESMVDAILSSFIEQTLADYEGVVAAGEAPTATFEGLIGVSLSAMAVHRSAILIYQKEARLLASEPRFSYVREAHRRFEEIWTGVLAEGVEHGEFRAEIDPKLVYRLVRDAVWTAPRWYRPGGPLDPEVIGAQYIGVLVDGVLAHG